MSELDYLSNIYDLLLDYQIAVNLFIAVTQFLICCFVIYILYKLFNIFF